MITSSSIPIPIKFFNRDKYMTYATGTKYQLLVGL
jgi:hypothetical protein